MTGRGRGRGGNYRSRFPSGRGGRGGNSSNNGTPIRSQKKSLADYVYYLGSTKQAADYEITTEYLINHIKKTFAFGSDIGTALENLEHYPIADHKPMLEISLEAEDQDIKEAENEQFKMDFKAEYDAYMRRKQMLEKNYAKAYAFLWEQCAKAMQNKIEARSDYESTIKGEPIELLKAIKQHALNYQEHRYAMSIVHDAMKQFLNIRQKENETLQEYTKRFKICKDVLESHLGGPIKLTKFMKTL